MDVGLDKLRNHPAVLRRLRGARVGVVAHPASVDRSLLHIGDVLAELNIVPRLYFGPEHGFGGEAQDMVGVEDARDPTTGARIVSLYGETFEELSPRPEDLAEIDVLVIDLADVGARYYTFIWTAVLCLLSAAKASVHVIVLDRPNPLGGDAAHAEGATVMAGFESFVGMRPVPVRHCLTLGEVVAREAIEKGLPLGPDGALSVVPLSGWDRSNSAAGWDRPFIQTSPNMPTLNTAIVYPGGCLLEGTNLSEGRGTTRPFEVLGAPWLDGRKLAGALSSSGLPGFHARPITFFPMFQKHAKNICGGIELSITDPASFRAYETYLALIGLACQAHPEHFAFRTERYEYVDNIPAFDLLTGSARARTALLAGVDPMEIARELAPAAEDWPQQLASATTACAQASFATP